MTNVYNFSNRFELVNILHQEFIESLDLSQQYFIVHDNKSEQSLGEVVAAEQLEWENQVNLMDLGGEPHEELCRIIGFNCIKYTYNMQAFGSPVCKNIDSYVFVNPFMYMVEIPSPPVQQHITTVIDSLNWYYQCDGNHDPTFEEYWPPNRYAAANERDYYIWDTLPGGWDAVDCRKYLGVEPGQYRYYRPPPSMGLILKPQHRVLLHPMQCRPLTKAEEDHLYGTEFNRWIESVFATGLPITSTPIPYYCIEVNLVHTHTPSRYALPQIPSPFRWETLKTERMA